MNKHIIIHTFPSILAQLNDVMSLNKLIGINIAKIINIITNLLPSKEGIPIFVHGNLDNIPSAVNVYTTPTPNNDIVVLISNI